MTEKKLPSDPEKFEDPLSDFEPIRYESELHRALMEDSADSIDTQPFIQISSSTTIIKAVQTMHDSKVSSLLVVDEKKVVGIFTVRDVLEKVAEGYTRLSDTEVGDVMTRNPTVIYETDPAAAALAAIAVEGHRHVPVLKVDNTPHGIVSPRRVFSFVEAHDQDR